MDPRLNNSGLISQVKITPSRMFPMYRSNIQQSFFFTKKRDVAWFWDFRFGHFNFVGLRTLQQKSMVIVLPQILSPSEICVECVVRKKSRPNKMESVRGKISVL